MRNCCGGLACRRKLGQIAWANVSRCAVSRAGPALRLKKQPSTATVSWLLIERDWESWSRPSGSSWLGSRIVNDPIGLNLDEFQKSQAAKGLENAEAAVQQQHPEA
jgi:hypothetical protein